MNKGVFRIRRNTLPQAAAACLLVLAGWSTAFAAEGGEAAHHGVSVAQMKDFGWRLLCFAVVFAILAWAVRKADVKGYLAGRRSAVEKALRDAAEAREEAERKFREYDEKLNLASREIDDIYAAIKKETETEKNRILADARATADRIREQAEATARQEVNKARRELQEEAARLSVELAAGTLRENVGKEDQDRFVDDFVDEYTSKVEKPH